MDSLIVLFNNLDILKQEETNTRVTVLIVKRISDKTLHNRRVDEIY